MKALVRTFSVSVIATAFLCAGGVAWATDNVRQSKVTAIFTYSTAAAVRYEPAYSNAEGCAGSLADNTVIIDWSSNPDVKAMYATVLTAYLTGREVAFGLSGCHPWGGGTPLAYRADLY
jgi:hypothetical protein